MKCSICGKEIEGRGNNAWPINDGRCCDNCNFAVVIPRRYNDNISKNTKNTDSDNTVKDSKSANNKHKHDETEVLLRSIKANKFGVAYLREKLDFLNACDALYALNLRKKDEDEARDKIIDKFSSNLLSIVKSHSARAVYDFVFTYGDKLEDDDIYYICLSKLAFEAYDGFRADDNGDDDE